MTGALTAGNPLLLWPLKTTPYFTINYLLQETDEDPWAPGHRGKGLAGLGRPA